MGSVYDGESRAQVQKPITVYYMFGQCLGYVTRTGKNLGGGCGKCARREAAVAQLLGERIHSAKSTRCQRCAGRVNLRMHHAPAAVEHRRLAEECILGVGMIQLAQ